MATRKEKIETILEGFHALRREIVFKAAGSVQTPRITPSQWAALMYIEQHEDCSVKDVASSLHISSSAATQLVDGLVASAYITRATNKKDRRVVTLCVSKKTQNHMVKMKKKVFEKFTTLFEVLNDTELEQFCSLNTKIVQRFLKSK